MFETNFAMKAFKKEWKLFWILTQQIKNHVAAFGLSLIFVKFGYKNVIVN